MYVVQCEISVESGKQKLCFNRVTSLEIRKSTYTLTDTAFIRLPASAVMKTVKATTTVETAKAIEAGMTIHIQVWYKGYEKQAISFTGYVRKVNRKTPVEIECEDRLGLLRGMNFNKDWKDTTLQAVLQELVKPVSMELVGKIPAIQLKYFYLKNKNGLEALQKIKDEFGVSVYMNTQDQLYCGPAYQENIGQVSYGLNGVNANIVRADNLLWQNKEDIQLCVKAISVLADNTCLIGKAGDESGALKVLRFHNITGQGELQVLAEQELNRWKFDGYRGKITGFLIPGVIPGMVAEIIDEKYPERGGNYFVESVRTIVGSSGCRNEVELGRRIG